MFLNNGFNPDLSGVNQAGKERAVGWGTNTYAPKGNYAPTPTTSTGVGQWTSVAMTNKAGDTGYAWYLPSGGTWAYYHGGFYADSNEYLVGISGIAAGGSRITTGKEITKEEYIKLLCYRIA